MELKHDTESEVAKSVTLLIVPYGIETNFYILVSNCILLLIVPYGIETGISE